MIIDKSSILQVFGSLMKHPQYLSEIDKYNLTPDDFGTRFYKYIFVAIDSLYRNGAARITPLDVENYLQTNDAASVIFKKENGIEFLQDAEDLSDPQNFTFYYGHLKKVNLLNSLNEIGISTTDFYVEDLADPRSQEINSKFENLDINEILDNIKTKVLSVENNYSKNDASETQTAYTNIEEILEEAEERTGIGMPIQGDIYNEVVAGARAGTLTIRSSASGVGKTRNAVGDACYLAYPFRFEEYKNEWVQKGSNEKVLFIATEQSFKEIQKMILSYLTGFNETKFRYGNFSDAEKKILENALLIMKEYEDNFHIVRMPNPTIGLVKNIIRENCLMHDIKYVFYDYIFIGPALLGEFKGFNLRNDEILLMFTTALKDLAVELDVCVMTSTQVNAKADDNSSIRNESTIAGSRSIINKADNGCVMARPTPDEIGLLENVISKYGIEPNVVTDIYKVRSGEYTQVRIWSYIDLGNLRKKDLFVTDARMNVIDNFNNNFALIVDWASEDREELNRVLSALNDDLDEVPFEE